MVGTRAGRLREWALVSDRMVKHKMAVAYESLRNSLRIKKKKKKMSVIISDVEIAKLYIQFFRRK